MKKRNQTGTFLWDLFQRMPLDGGTYKNGIPWFRHITYTIQELSHIKFELAVDLTGGYDE